MASAFYTDDKLFQEQVTDTQEKSNLQYSLEDNFDILHTSNTIVNNVYQKIALQFPDELLLHAPAVVALLKKHTLTPGVKRQLYILGDTSYGACCVDEVAAEHMNADFIVHYGRACMSKTTRLPVLYVFGKKKVDVEHLSQSILNAFKPSDKLILFYDVGYRHAMADLEQRVKHDNVIFAHVNREAKRTATSTKTSRGCCNQGQCTQSGCESGVDNKNSEGTCKAGTCISCQPEKPVATDTNTNTETISQTTASTETTDTTSDGATTVNGRNVQLLPGTSLQDYAFLYIGEEDATLSNLMMTNNKSQFYLYNPDAPELRKLSDVNRNLIRRYHYIEKARDADIIGIVVATLGVEGYMDVINRMKAIIRDAGKKSYLIVVGKLNEFKLGNFQEIDIFVLVACTENTLIDSKNYYKPVMTPFELEIALVRGREWTGDYRTDFEYILRDFEPPKEEEDDERAVRFSLNSQKLMKNPKHIEIELESSTDLATRNNNLEMMTNSFATTYLASRSWRGLEQHIGETPVSAPVEGRSGIASVYEGEPK